MPFIPNTPESLLGRTDSLNPATTCRGVTGGGKPCRRPLTSSDGSSPGPSPVPSPGTGRNKSRVSRLRVDDPSNPDLYCWQHRDQASSSAKSSPGPRLSQTPILESRASLDTLMDRLGIVEAQQKQKHKRSSGHRPHGTPTRPPRRPVAENPNSSHRPPHSTQSPSSPPPVQNKTSTFCFCFNLPPSEEEIPTRPRPVPLQSAPAKLPAGQRPSAQHLAPPQPASGRPSMASSSHRKSSGRSTKSQTSQYLKLIPGSASPQTASQLMAELAKPISQQDEAGYIYIFWLTPEDKSSTEPAEAAKSLLSPPPRGGAGKRRTSDVLDAFASNPTINEKDGKKKILLKIGRASNVQRRLNEWTRQCGYNLSLIRYYPHIPTNRPSTPRKVPHSHKVERLVHLELAGLGLRVSDSKNCDACGKAHREWFEVDASRQAVMMVDEIVKRWSDWDEAHP